MVKYYAKNVVIILRNAKGRIKMRDTVSGIGEKIGILMKEKNVSYNELNEKTGISINILKAIVKSQKEPYVFPEMERILIAFDLNDQEKLDFFENWIKMRREKNLTKWNYLQINNFIISKVWLKEQSVVKYTKEGLLFITETRSSKGIDRN